MSINIVLALTGADRVGIVDDVTELLLDLNGNVENSRMARLGGEFAMLMLISLPSEQLASLDKVTKNLTAQGYKVTATQTEQTCAETHPDWLPYQIDVRGADHQGILHQVAHHLSQYGINIETLEGGTSRAPISGTLLFTLTAQVAVPPSLSEQEWLTALQEAEQRLNIDITVTPRAK